MNIFELPDLGEGLPDAIIREWYIKEGDEVKVDQPIVAMETAKALVDVPSPYTGTIEKLFGNEGDTINTHDALVGYAGEGLDSTREDSGTVVGAIEESGEVMTDAAAGIVTSKASGSRAKATPAVRMLAKQMGVDIDSLTPANGSHLTADDVKAAMGSAPAKTAGKDVPIKGDALTGIRRAMVMSMVKSHSEIVPVTLCDDADIHAWEKQDVTVRLLRAISDGINTESMVNSHFHGATLSVETFLHVNIGMAVDTPHGLFVPVIKDVANKSDSELRADINRFKEQAMSKSIPQDDLHGATIMLSNFGSFAGKYANPIIVPPMVCILGVGRSRDCVVPENGTPVIHKIMPLSVSIDHRAVTGGEATRFLKAVMDALSQ